MAFSNVPTTSTCDFPRVGSPLQQRALVTLNTAGWIRPASGEVTRRVMTTRALTVGGRASGDLDLRGAAVPIMEDLRRHTRGRF
jgi:DNA-binding IclR family transcriptional regulator